MKLRIFITIIFLLIIAGFWFRFVGRRQEYVPTPVQKPIVCAQLNLIQKEDDTQKSKDVSEIFSIDQPNVSEALFVYSNPNLKYYSNYNVFYSIDREHYLSNAAFSNDDSDPNNIALDLEKNNYQLFSQIEPKNYYRVYLKIEGNPEDGFPVEIGKTEYKTKRAIFGWSVVDNFYPNGHTDVGLKPLSGNINITKAIFITDQVKKASAEQKYVSTKPLMKNDRDKYQIDLEANEYMTMYLLSGYRISGGNKVINTEFSLYENINGISQQNLSNQQILAIALRTGEYEISDLSYLSKLYFRIIESIFAFIVLFLVLNYKSILAKIKLPLIYNIKIIQKWAMGLSAYFNTHVLRFFSLLLFFIVLLIVKLLDIELFSSRTKILFLFVIAYLLVSFPKKILLILSLIAIVSAAVSDYPETPISNNLSAISLYLIITFLIAIVLDDVIKIFRKLMRQL